MSKLDIGVGDEFPLDEGKPEDGRHAHRHHKHHRHGHHHAHHGLLHLPLFLAVAGIAAMIGAGRIPPMATDVILALAAILVLLAVVAHLRFHRRWHADQKTQ